ncbi:MAG: hypothetical protein ACK5LY_09580 [Lachnospirales bacterium]
MKGFQYIQLHILDEEKNGNIIFLEEELDFVLERTKIELELVNDAFLGEEND